MDVIYLAIVFVLFGLSLGMVGLFERLR